MASVLRFRTVWGISPGTNYENWAKWFPTLKKQGYAGVEVDFTDLEDLPTIRRIADDAGLEISVLIHAQWPSYAGPKPPGPAPKDLLQDYRSKLQIAQSLKPYKINAHSGNERWTVDETVEFYSGTLNVDAELGLTGKVCHETHRNTAFFSPQSTAPVLQRVPKLRVTADFSHFVVVCERLLDVYEEDISAIRTIIPHVGHIHARMGTTQASQCPDPTHEAFKEERKYFETVWKQIIDATATSSEPITFVPEYGPFPYHPFNAQTTFSDVADSEGARLHPIFESHAHSAVASRQ
ncbi:unnamed protein product [Penicillium salamii]|uniref:Xylose isomerase-like TIM barrel domain-containing protein n=1 Tax=Penicillium salamii TaxID=1612424 RepID=A0A9W4NZF2_9EURO|nr:unnamed protein product [Penicillium salamii]CAG8408475.1 unnamed protein product [Penicillium salamii]CAG8428301.1 unnamed protein product [Penicillium salamii]